MSKIDDKSSTVTTADETTLSSAADATMKSSQPKQRKSASSMTESSIDTDGIYSAFGIDRPANEEPERRKSATSMTVSSFNTNDIYSAFGVDRDDVRRSVKSIAGMGIEIVLGDFDPKEAPKNPKKTTKKAVKSKTPVLETIPHEKPDTLYTIPDDAPSQDTKNDSDRQVAPENFMGLTPEAKKDEKSMQPLTRSTATNYKATMPTPPVESHERVGDEVKMASIEDAKDKEDSFVDVEAPSLKPTKAVKVRQDSVQGDRKENKGNRKLKPCLLIFLILAAAGGGAAYFNMKQNNNRRNNGSNNSNGSSGNNGLGGNN